MNAAPSIARIKVLGAALRDRMSFCVGCNRRRCDRRVGERGKFLADQGVWLAQTD